MGLYGSENSLQLLKSAALKKLESLSKAASMRLIGSGQVSGAIAKISLLADRIQSSRREDDAYEAIGHILALEKQLGEKIPSRTAFRVVSMSFPQKRAIPFFSYMLGEEMPQPFVHNAMDFYDRVRDFGVGLSVDEGVVVATSSDNLSYAGHLVRVFSPQPAVWSELPRYLRFGGRLRRGEYSQFPISCSVRLDNSMLGISAHYQIANFVFASMESADDWSRLVYSQLQKRFYLGGFSLELNEDGHRLNIRLLSKNGTSCTATLFSGRLEAPPGAWGLAQD